MGRMELRWVLGGRFIQHQYLDDLLVYDHRVRTFVVAVVDLCLDRLLTRCWFRLPDRPNWRDLSYRVPRRRTIVFWHLGITVACVQPSSYGVHLVRRSSLAWRQLRQDHDFVDLAQLPDDPEHAR